MKSNVLAWTRRAWTGLKSAVLRGLSDGPFGMLRGIFPANTTQPPAIGTQDLLEGHDTMPWLRACGDKASTSVACVDWRLLARRGKDGKYVRDRVAQRSIGEARMKLLDSQRRVGQLDEITDHVFFDMLEQPNEMMDRFSLLKLLNLHLDLVGEAYWIKQRNKLGVWVGSWPVPPHWVFRSPTPGTPAFTVLWRGWKADIPFSEVVWWRDPSAANPYTRGSGVGWALGDEVEVDEYAAKMAKALFFNQARPDVVIYGFDDVDQKRQVERDWITRLQGFWRAHKPYFMTGEPKFHEFQRPTMEQLVYPSLRTSQRDIVMQTWGIPPEMFGISESGNLSRVAYEAAEYLFAKYVTFPRAERIRGPLQREVQAEYDERLILSYVSPVPEDKEYELNVMKAAGWAWDGDEWRARGGYAPDTVAGKGRLVPLNSYVTTDPLDAAQRPASAGNAMRATDQAGGGGKDDGKVANG